MFSICGNSVLFVLSLTKLLRISDVICFAICVLSSNVNEEALQLLQRDGVITLDGPRYKQRS